MKFQSVLFGLALLSLAACGGGTTPVTTTPPPSTPSGIGLGDTSSSSPVGVRYLTVSGASDGVFTPSSQMGDVSGRSVAAIGGSINDPFSYVRLLEDASVAVVAPTGTAPSGVVRYTGNAILVVTDVPQAVNYDGTANAQLDIRLDGIATGTLDLTGFTGTRQSGSSAPISVSSGRLTVQGLSATASGLAGGTGVANVQFGDADFTGASIDVNGEFAGPNFAEVGGSMDINATDGQAKITFAASR